MRLPLIALLVAAPVFAQEPDVPETPDAVSESPVEAPAPSEAVTRIGPRTFHRPYQLNYAVDGLVMLAAGGLWGLPELMLNELVILGRCPCDPKQLNALDRRFAGVSVPNTADITTVSTIVLLLLPTVIDFIDVVVSQGTLWEWVEDSLVSAEALIVSGAATELAKIAFQRPRPVAYGLDPGDPKVNAPDTYQSFYSLAAALAFTTATSGAVTYALRHPDGAGRWVYLGSAYAAAAAFGISRFVTGKHFPTDVIVAAAMGSLVGLAVPLLHRRAPLSVGFGATESGGFFSLSGALP